MHQRTFSITNPSFMNLGIPHILLWQTYIVKHTQCWSLDIKQTLKLLISPARHLIMHANKIQNTFSEFHIQPRSRCRLCAGITIGSNRNLNIRAIFLLGGRTISNLDHLRRALVAALVDKDGVVAVHLVI
jgi:hypothetical protein